jgi:hypothetical protein
LVSKGFLALTLTSCALLFSFCLEGNCLLVAEGSELMHVSFEDRCFDATFFIKCITLLLFVSTPSSPSVQHILALNARHLLLQNKNNLVQEAHEKQGCGERCGEKTVDSRSDDRKHE